MTIRTRLVTGAKLEFENTDMDPSGPNTPDKVWQIKESGHIVLGRAIVEVGGKLTVIDYDYTHRIWYQTSQWHLGLTPDELAQKVAQ